MFEQDRQIILGDYQYFSHQTLKKYAFFKLSDLFFSNHDIKPLLCQNHSSTFVYGPILMKNCMNANII